MEAGILRLPNEVLIQIFEVDPGNPGVFSISTLCRRLHYLALPIYLTAHGIPDPQALPSQDLILTSTQLHLLDPLQTALFIRSLKHISYSFSLDRARIRPYSPRESGLYKFFFYHVRRLAGFLENLEQVDEVTLDFRQIYYAVFSEGRQALECLKAWESTIFPLLGAALGKGCTAFNVYGGTFIVHKSQRTSLQPVVPMKQPSVLSALGLRIHRVASMFGRRIRRKAEVEKKTPLGLRTLNIHSNIFLLPPCYDWTMATLRASPSLISLSIVHDDIGEWDGDDILSNIHAPRLQHFAMDLNCSVTAAALQWFFARHPHIGASSFGTRVALPTGMRCGAP